MAVKAFGVSAAHILWAFGATFVFALSAPAGLFLTTSAPTSLPGPDNLLQYTVFMNSNSGEVVDGFSFASASTITGLGVHQVWTPLVDLPTPTRQSQLDSGSLWSDTWLPYDTYYFPTSLNSLKTPGQIVETNSGTGAVLPTAGFGAPVYRIWNNKLTTPGHARRRVARRLWLHRGKWLAKRPRAADASCDPRQ